MSFEEQAEALVKKPSAEFNFTHQGQDIPVRFKPGNVECKVLIILFHGAVDREVRQVPAFVPFLPGVDAVAHQLAISDPTMLKQSGFSMSWYAGHEGFHSQHILPELFKAVAAALGVDRVIYFGTSGGGFASLYYSWHHPKSVAIVGNPQTDIRKYYAGHTKNYLEHCWPNASDTDDLGNLFESNVTQLYAQSTPNFVIYIQSSTDSFHIKNHLAPFLAAMKFSKGELSFIPHVDFFGKFGHSPTFDSLSVWVRAACLSTQIDASSILKLHSVLRYEISDGDKSEAKGERESSESRDAEFANILKQQLLKGSR